MATVPVDAVVLDMDGVIVDSEAMWDAARRAVVAEYGGAWEASSTRDMMGMSSPEWSAHLHNRLGVPLAPETISRLVVERMIVGYRERLPLLPGAVAAVQRIASRWPLGLASSSNRPVIDAALSASGLDRCFAVTVSSEEVARGKPAPDVYQAAVAALGVAPGRAVAIEDSTNGLRAAASAGMRVIALPNQEFPPAPDALAHAAVVLGSLDELTVDAVLAAAR